MADAERILAAYDAAYARFEIEVAGADHLYAMSIGEILESGGEPDLAAAQAEVLQIVRDEVQALINCVRDAENWKREADPEFVGSLFGLPEDWNVAGEDEPSEKHLRKLLRMHRARHLLVRAALGGT